ncbi:MAG: glutathione S-transferase N-terminal domain-containing protein [Rhodospirillales bacterium]|nr:glutathione S-transferase N-terminal domain-containing protein [Rhodospirillales bacterium]
MTYVLFGHRWSGSLTVKMVLAEIGARYEVRDVDREDKAQRDDAYAIVNLQRKIAAFLTPDGATLTESVAILLTLVGRHPGTMLLPEDAAERVRNLARSIRHRRWLRVERAIAGREAP